MRALLVWVVTAAACGGGNNNPSDAPAGPKDAPASSNSIHVVLAGTGGGGVTSDGIDCGADCSEEYRSATSIVLVAQPSADSVLTKWSHECASPQPNTCVLNVVGDITVTVTFDHPKLVVGRDQTDGTGAVASNVGACGSGCDLRVPAGTSVTVTAAPDPATHSALARWTYPGCTGTGPCTFVMPSADVSFEAAFGRDNSVDNGATTYTKTMEGSPAWTVDGFEVTPIFGSAQPTALAQIKRLWEGHAYNPVQSALYPLTAHAGPYETEVERRSEALGWDTGNHFPFIDWSIAGGRTLMFAAVIVPTATAPIGSTRDYASGPILPRTIMLYSDADLYKDGVLIDPDFGDGPYPPLAQTDPASTEAGQSHMPLTWYEDQSFIPGTPGNYRFHVHVYEVNTPANGWQIDVPFVIEP